MSPKKGARIGSENVETSKTAVAAVVAKSIVNVAVMAIDMETVAPSVAELNAPQVQGDVIEPPNGREEMLEGHVQEVIGGQDKNDDEDGEVTDQARNF